MHQAVPYVISMASPRPRVLKLRKSLIVTSLSTSGEAEDSGSLLIHRSQTVYDDLQNLQDFIPDISEVANLRSYLTLFI